MESQVTQEARPLTMTVLRVRKAISKRSIDYDLML